MKKSNFNLTREQALGIICTITSQDNPCWEHFVDDFYDEDTGLMPTVEDVLSPLGVTKEEIDRASSISG